MHSPDDPPKHAADDTAGANGFAIPAETLRQIGTAAGISVWTYRARADTVFQVAIGDPETPLRHGASLKDTLQGIHPADRAKVRRQLKAAVKSGTPGSLRFRSKPRDGTDYYFSATYYAIGPGEVQVIVQDVTRATKAELALRESIDHYRTAVDLNPEIPWLADADGNIIEFGPRWLEMVSLGAEQTLGDGWASALHPDDLRPTLRDWRSSLETGRPVDIEYRIRLKDGAYRWMRARARARRDESGRILRWYGTLEDIHDKKMAEDALRESEEFSRSILEASAVAIEVLDSAGRLIFINGPGLRIMEVDDFDDIRLTRFESFFPTDQTAVHDAIALAMNGETTRLTLEAPTAKGSPRWWDLSVSPILGADGRVARVLAMSRDITEAKLNEQEVAAGVRRLAHLARHDALTGLPNRMHFQEELEGALARRRGGEALAVLSVDLDDFKLVNDTLGHPAGDRLLCEVARRLRGAAVARDLVARLGGDEFALLLQIEKPEDAAMTAQAVLRAIDRPFVIEGEPVHIGASIGIALVPKDGTDAESLLQYADVALYRVKGEKGRDFRFFEPAMDQALRERREMKRDLGLALSRGELNVVYQPQVEIGSNRLVGFEALLRWNSKGRGPVPPGVFVPLAEESGLIEAIGAFVLREAAAEAVNWPQSVSLAVNLSPMQFRSRGVMRAVTEVLEATGLAPERLELEITESVLLDGSAEALDVLEALHRLGIRVALDDFGTGYSSLSYLRRFAFDKIKIDRSFISDLPGAEDSAAIVRAIVALGRSLRTRVTAEGVETWEQLLALREEGCTEAQGYLFARPMPAAQARALAEAGFAASEVAAPRRRRRG